MWDRQGRAWQTRREALSIERRNHFPDCVAPWRNEETVLFAVGLARR
jgi:hypothetical protein